MYTIQVETDEEEEEDDVEDLGGLVRVLSKSVAGSAKSAAGGVESSLRRLGVSKSDAKMTKKHDDKDGLSPDVLHWGIPLQQWKMIHILSRAGMRLATAVERG